MKSPIFPEFGILYIDHLAVTTADFDQALADYLHLPQARLLKGPNTNLEQRVKYAFIQLPGGWVIELLAPEPNSPIQEHVQRGGGPYHFCYAVADIEQSIDRAKNAGSRLVMEPIADVAFDGRKVAFLFHPAHGIFEFVEAFPSGVSTDQVFSLPPAPGDLQKNSPAVSPPGNHQLLIEQLKQVFIRVFPGLKITDSEHICMGSVQEWTSLRHLQLMMELETEFDIEIPAQSLSELTSFTSILKEILSRISLR